MRVMMIFHSAIMKHFEAYPLDAWISTVSPTPCGVGWPPPPQTLLSSVGADLPFNIFNEALLRIFDTPSAGELPPADTPTHGIPLY
jgi:hypothetical protein